LGKFSNILEIQNESGIITDETKLPDMIICEVDKVGDGIGVICGDRAQTFQAKYMRHNSLVNSIEMPIRIFEHAERLNLILSLDKRFQIQHRSSFV
jgi:hypothetical protein